MRCSPIRNMCAAWWVAYLVTCGAGCTPAESSVPDVQVDLTVTPSPPVVGDADVSLTLADRRGTPMKGADVNLEGNMNHAGMKPSFAEMVEVEPGHYAGTLRFTMGGDWFILVKAKTPDGRTIEQKIDVPGVKVK